MRSPLDRLAVLIGTAFYTGYAPLASGTFGSLVGVALVFLMKNWRWPWFGVAFLVILTAGTWSSARCADIFGSKDPRQVVVDEVAGMILSLAFVPRTLSWTAAGFFLFRLFDIIKPPPANWADRQLEGGLGIMLDDLVAGAYTWVVLQAALRCAG